MAIFDWKAFLTQWSRDLLQDDTVVESLPADVVALEWLGYPGATEDQMAALEAHLGTRLPPSYRAFLAVTNGWRNTTSFIDALWSTDEAEWFAVRNQDWIDAYYGFETRGQRNDDVADTLLLGR